MKKVILIVLVMITIVSCKSSKHTNCDAYGSVSKTTQK
jgi:hypothetical protein